MSPVTLSLSLPRMVALAISASVAMAQAPPMATYPAVPLAQKGPYNYPDGIPYKVDTDTNLIRGTQIGYNICNATTENQQSLCQTSFLNDLDDFCLWAPAEYGATVGDIEGSMIAWCTKPGHGTRLIPEGALHGVQFTKTPDYVQVVGFIDQTKINILEGDYGGEMDPHGADLRGNPMGGIMFSNRFTGQYTQAIEWHNFIGSNSFCLKLCDPRGANAANYCEHIFDRIGCKYNAPNEARNGTFEACEGENQDFPGIYTGADGVTSTYTQPPESLGPITTVTYEPRIPKSSNCVQFESKSIYTGLPTASVAAPSSSATSSSQTNGGSSSSATSRSSASNSNSAAPSTQTDTSGAGQVVASSAVLVSALFGVAMLLA
ncbi:hypothetical protein JR316_0005564 [Psilocybe cubensis]|uniref:Mannoprotein n=2 Tax=Psilocybe cubensis TaxID=181762 RepID=A0A8H7XY02_PSICU|nr:hypothetical protein JR316_0005564 [Psilocybe cubensis]KAH9481045.1 hypothetical protein JR316_0005564 [Psilocybe cubensis]